MPFLLALLGGALVRWTAVLAYPHGLWFTGDSFFYIGYALRMDKPSGSKSLGYSFMLHALEPLHSLTAVVVVQHAMGLAVAVMAYAVLCRAGLPPWVSTLVTLPMLFDAYQVELEHLLMSEALFTFLIAAALTLLLWRVGDRAGPTWWMALAAGLLLGYAVLVRSAGAPLVPVVLLCLLLRRRGWLPALAFGAAAAVPLLAYASWFHAERGTYALTTSDGLFLWGRTAGFADCAKIRPPSNEEALCLDPATKAEKDPPGHLIWRNDVPPRVLFESVINPESNATLRDFAIRAIRAQPGDYLRTVRHGIGMAFADERSPHPTAATEELYHFTDRPQIFPGGRSWAGGSGTALSDAMRYGRTDSPSEVVEPHAGRMIRYQEHVSLTGPALGTVFALGAVGLIAAHRRRREVLMAWGTAVTLLVFPIASADFDYRYVVPAMPFACLAVGLALSALRVRPAGAKTGDTDPEHNTDGADEERDDSPKDSSEHGSGEKGLSRWWGTLGSRHRDSDPATVP